MQLYRCEWLNDLQRSNVLLAINAMSEKSTFMGVNDLPIVRAIETVPLEPGEQKKASMDKRRSSLMVPGGLPSELSTATFSIEDSSSLLYSRPSIVVIDSKHDTRIVNEAFQVKKKHEEKDMN